MNLAHPFTFARRPVSYRFGPVRLNASDHALGDANPASAPRVGAVRHRWIGVAHAAADDLAPSSAPTRRTQSA